MRLTEPGLELPLQQEKTIIMMPAGVVFCRGCWKTAVAIVLVLSVGGAPLNAKGKTERVNEPREYFSGLAAGHSDARGSGVWVLSGLNLGPTRLILPWVIGTEVPGGNLVGKSAQYVGGYVDEYQSKAKPRNFQYSLVAGAGRDSDQEAMDCVCGVLDCTGFVLNGVGEVATSIMSLFDFVNSCHLP
jgi:hypothetical protein